MLIWLKLWLLKRYLRRLGGDVALWLSGGKDSRLLLEIMLAERLRFSILRFDETWSREQRAVVDELIKRHDLRVYSYAPRWGTMVGGEDGEMALISGYAVASDSTTASLFRDMVDGERCAFDVPLTVSEREVPPIRFETHIVGTKKNESHWATANRPFTTAKRWEVGDVDFVAPLFTWSDADVIKALRRYGIEWSTPSLKQDTGNSAICSNCLRERRGGMAWCPKAGAPIPTVKWSPSENLAAFQQAAGIGSV